MFYFALTCITVLILLFIVLLYHYLHAYKIFHPKRLKYSQSPESLGLNFAEYSVTTSDGYRLEGWSIFPTTPPKGTVIISHNLGANMQKKLPYARFLCKAGYNVVLFDFRSHGKSSQYRRSFKIIRSLERDLKAVIDFVKGSDWFISSNKRLGLMGFSMGTIPVITVARDLPEVKALLLDSGPFLSIEWVFTRILKRTLKLPRLFSPSLYVLIIKVMLGMRENYIPCATEKLSPRAIYFISGEKDNLISPDDTAKLYNKHASEPKSYWLVPGSYHLTNRYLYPQEYKDNVLNFFDRYLM